MINISIQQLWDGQISKIFSDKENFQKYGALPRFLRSKYFFIDREKELVYYFDGLKIPKVKMTIVSATLNEKLYKDYLKALGDTRVIYLYKIPEVKYKGELAQYTAASMSRKCIGQYGFSAVKKRTYKTAGVKNDCKCITFKKYAGDDDIYFGKNEGVNDYKGKDIVIIGTPHNLPVVYELIGGFMGYKKNDSFR